jgi:TRAP-type C4-dicarboxylate transport system substrate-binding protein
MMHTSKPVETISAVKGLKIRTGGGVQAQIAKRLGLVSVSAPATKAQEILQQGVADGIFFSIETIYAFKLGGVVKYHYSLPGNFYSASFAAIMNKRKFDSMTKADQAALMRASGERMSRNMGKTWDGSDALAIRELTKAGNTIKPFDPAISKVIRAKIADLDQWWIARAKKEGLADPAAVLKSLREEIKKVKVTK